MSRSKIPEMIHVCKDFVMAIKSYNAELLNRPKFHLLLHLPQSVQDFGPTASYSAERYCIVILIVMLFNIRRGESFNGNVRLQNLQSNRHASSLDISTKYAKLQHLRMVA